MKDQNLDYQWFENNKNSLFAQFPNKQLVISEEQVLGAFDTFEDALEFALSKMKAGEFNIQECTDSDTNAYYYNHAVRFG